MDKEIEKMICKKFINKTKSDRLLYELSSKNKRTTAIGRFSHNSTLYLNPNLIFKSKKMLFSKNEIIDFLATTTVYCICFNTDFDGKLINLEEVLSLLYSMGPYFLINVNNSSMFLETEYNFSEHYSYFLK